MEFAGFKPDFPDYSALVDIKNIVIVVVAHKTNVFKDDRANGIGVGGHEVLRTFDHRHLPGRIGATDLQAFIKGIIGIFRYPRTVPHPRLQHDDRSIGNVGNGIFQSIGVVNSRQIDDSSPLEQVFIPDPDSAIQFQFAIRNRGGSWGGLEKEHQVIINHSRSGSCHHDFGFGRGRLIIVGEGIGHVHAVFPESIPGLQGTFGQKGKYPVGEKIPVVGNLQRPDPSGGFQR